MPDGLGAKINALRRFVHSVAPQAASGAKDNAVSPADDAYRLSFFFGGGDLDSLNHMSRWKKDDAPGVTKGVCVVRPIQ